jgi:hypothetical protein
MQLNTHACGSVDQCGTVDGLTLSMDCAGSQCDAAMLLSAHLQISHGSMHSQVCSAADRDSALQPWHNIDAWTSLPGLDRELCFTAGFVCLLADHRDEIYLIRSGDTGVAVLIPRGRGLQQPGLTKGASSHSRTHATFVTSDRAACDTTSDPKTSVSEAAPPAGQGPTQTRPEAHSRRLLCLVQRV